MRQAVIAHHLILYAYGQWLSNDLRGSGSTEIREPKFKDLGDIHFGRKPIQPPKSELKEFYRQANPRLEFEPVWFDTTIRQVIADAFDAVVSKRNYTVWACAILTNHAHILVRRHRDNDETIWNILAGTAANYVREKIALSQQHPVWAERPYAVFQYTPADVRRTDTYIKGNPEKEGLPPQNWPFVKIYDGWPLHKRNHPP
jgi:REP element-mobilizing transposase RayT